jgi:hypothetical protein
MFNKASKNVCTSTIPVLPEPLFPTPSTLSAMKILENTEEDHDDPQPADEVDIQMENSSNYMYSPSIRNVTKN